MRHKFFWHLMVICLGSASLALAVGNQQKFLQIAEGKSDSQAKPEDSTAATDDKSTSQTPDLTAPPSDSLDSKTEESKSEDSKEETDKNDKKDDSEKDPDKKSEQKKQGKKKRKKKTAHKRKKGSKTSKSYAPCHNPALNELYNRQNKLANCASAEPASQVPSAKEGSAAAPSSPEAPVSE